MVFETCFYLLIISSVGGGVVCCPARRRDIWETGAETGKKKPFRIKRKGIVCGYEGPAAAGLGCI